MPLKFLSDFVTLGEGEADGMTVARQSRDQELQSILLALIVSQYDRTKDASIGKDAFVKTVLSDYAALVAAARFVAEAKTDEERPGSGVSMYE